LLVDIILRLCKQGSRRECRRERGAWRSAFRAEMSNDMLSLINCISERAAEVR